MGEAEGLKQGMLGGLWGVSVKETLGSVVCVAEQTLRLLPESWRGTGGLAETQNRDSGGCDNSGLKDGHETM